VPRLAQWIKDAAEKKKEVEDEKKARREKRRAGPKHVFTDHEYMNQIQANAESIDDALKQGEEHYQELLMFVTHCLITVGLAASSSSSNVARIKRPSTVEPSLKSKKIHLW